MYYPIQFQNPMQTYHNIPYVQQHQFHQANTANNYAQQANYNNYTGRGDGYNQNNDTQSPFNNPRSRKELCKFYGSASL